MDKLQERPLTDSGAAEHAQTRTHSPQEPPVKANEEQVGKVDHHGSQRTSGTSVENIDGRAKKKNAKTGLSKGRKGKRVA